jgi:hypothetical protein
MDGQARITPARFAAASIWYGVAYAPRFVRHAWHRRSYGLGESLASTRRRMRHYR